MVTEQVGRTNAWYAALVIYGYWLPVENYFFHKKLIILKSTYLQRKFILIKLPVQYSNELMIYKKLKRWVLFETPVLICPADPHQEICLK